MSQRLHKVDVVSAPAERQHQPDSLSLSLKSLISRLVCYSLCFSPPPRCRCVLTASAAAAVLTFCSPVGWLAEALRIKPSTGIMVVVFLLCAEREKNDSKQSRAFNCLLFSVFQRKSVSLLWLFPVPSCVSSHCYHSLTTLTKKALAAGGFR